MIYIWFIYIYEFYIYIYIWFIHDDLWWFIVILTWCLYNDLWYFMIYFNLYMMIYDDVWWCVMMCDDWWWYDMIWLIPVLNSRHCDTTMPLCFSTVALVISSSSQLSGSASQWQLVVEASEAHWQGKDAELQLGGQTGCWAQWLHVTRWAVSPKGTPN